MTFSKGRVSFVALPQHKRQRGAGYFEFAVVAIILAILGGVMLQKMVFYQQEAERLAVDKMLGTLRAALAVEAAALYLRGKEDQIPQLAKKNPMDLLKLPPPNYLGEIDDPKLALPAEGVWYFDRSSSTLSYVLNQREFFTGNTSRRLNFKVKFQRNPTNLTDSHKGPGPGGVTLEKVD